MSRETQPSLQFAIFVGTILFGSLFTGTASAQRVRIQEKKLYGFSIESVTDESPAFAAGIRISDIITQVEGRQITSEEQFLQAVRDAAANNRELTLIVADRWNEVETVRRVRPDQRDGKIGIDYTFLPPEKARTVNRLPLQEFIRRVERLTSSGKLSLPEPEFDWRGATLRYRLEPALVPNIYDDPNEAVLAELSTIQAIRTYRMRSDTQREFWRPLLTEVEGKVSVMIQEIQAGQKTQEELVDALLDHERSISDLYQTRLDSLAKDDGKRGAEPKGRQHETQLYEISIRMVPPQGELKYMAAGRWLMLLLRNDNREPDWSDSTWSTAAQGGTIQLGQMTRFAVRWPDGASRAATMGVEKMGGMILVASKRFGFRWER
jgi:hypothetical protein